MKYDVKVRSWGGHTVATIEAKSAAHAVAAYLVSQGDEAYVDEDGDLVTAADAPRCYAVRVKT